MLRPGKSQSQSNRNLQLPKQSGIPGFGDIAFVMEQAQKGKGKKVELPYSTHDNRVEFLLTVQDKFAEDTTEWCLIQRAAGGEQILWHHNSRDLALITNLVSTSSGAEPMQDMMLSGPVRGKVQPRPTVSATAPQAGPSHMPQELRPSAEPQPSTHASIPNIPFSIQPGSPLQAPPSAPATPPLQPSGAGHTPIPHVPFAPIEQAQAQAAPLTQAPSPQMPVAGQPPFASELQVPAIPAGQTAIPQMPFPSAAPVTPDPTSPDPTAAQFAGINPAPAQAPTVAFPDQIAITAAPAPAIPPQSLFSAFIPSDTESTNTVQQPPPVPAPVAPDPSHSFQSPIQTAAPDAPSTPNLFVPPPAIAAAPEPAHSVQSTPLPTSAPEPPTLVQPAPAPPLVAEPPNPVRSAPAQTAAPEAPKSFQSSFPASVPIAPETLSFLESRFATPTTGQPPAANQPKPGFSSTMSNIPELPIKPVESQLQSPLDAPEPFATAAENALQSLFSQSTPSAPEAESPLQSRFSQPIPSTPEAENPLQSRFSQPIPSTPEVESPLQSRFSQPTPSTPEVENPLPSSFSQPTPSTPEAENPFQSRFSPPTPSIPEAENPFQSRLSQPTASTPEAENPFQSRFSQPAPATSEPESQSQSRFADPPPAPESTSPSPFSALSAAASALSSYSSPFSALGQSVPDPPTGLGSSTPAAEPVSPPPASFSAPTLNAPEAINSAQVASPAPQANLSQPHLSSNSSVAFEATRPDARPAIEGDLQNQSVPNLLQSISQSELSGRLDIRNGSENAEVYFANGVVLHCTVKETIGNRALLELICWKNGQYRFCADEKTSLRTVNKSLEALIGQGLALEDQYKWLETNGLRLESCLVKKNALISEEELKDRLSKGIPYDVEPQLDFYELVDNRNTLFALLQERPISKSEWVPILFNLVNLGLVLITDQPPQSNRLANLKALGIDEGAVQGIIKSLVKPETGILSFAAFIYLLDQEYLRYEFFNQPFSLIIFSMGQRKSDTGQVYALPMFAIRRAMQRIGLVKRQVDFLGHYEDYDYAILMPNTNAAAATALAHKVTEVLREAPMASDIDARTLALAFGVATVPEDCQALDKLIQVATRARDQAKASNRIVVQAREIMGQAPLP